MPRLKINKQTPSLVTPGPGLENESHARNSFLRWPVHEPRHHANRRIHRAGGSSSSSAGSATGASDDPGQLKSDLTKIASTATPFATDGDMGFISVDRVGSLIQKDSSQDGRSGISVVTPIATAVPIGERSGTRFLRTITSKLSRRSVVIFASVIY
ncbi:unnamed protein product [Protopolystoma xenopodis]|uniref:Uncharacterized protein n=1 Tax=Protopolystoma xenopodis TaxID=117903 RepID=A0A3S5AMK7_9PLAT|nr:unnamed protein product [Protopolystoma xenopodis]